MKIKNHLAVAGLILAFTNLDSVKAQAEHFVLSTQCDPFTIAVTVSVDEYVSIEGEREILNNKALEMCSGHPYVIDYYSIKRNRYQIAGTGFDPKFATRVTARVSCMND